MGLSTVKIGIIGCGNMGEAIFSRLAGVLEKSTALMVSEIDAKRRDYLQGRYKIIVETDNLYLSKCSDIIIIAVKPKDFEEALKALCCAASKDKLIISIAAGVAIRHIEKALGKDVPVIRAMPNMAAAIGESITTLSRGSAAGDGHLAVAKEIFSLVGEVVEVDEKLVDAVTAISASGPAYFFYFLEAMMKAARALGLDAGTAERLVFKTARGSMKLIDHLKEDPAVLRAKVASKGGTTEAALKVFESKKFHDVVKSAVTAACRRSKELSKKAGS